MKKLTKILLIGCISLLLAFGFVGCKKDCEHVYDNACDVTCNECGETREVGAHDFSDVSFDDYYHWDKCSNCDALKDEDREKHVFDDDHACECGVTFTVTKESGEADLIEKYYNAEGNLVYELAYLGNEVWSVIEYYYNDNGKCVKEVFVDINDFSYTFDYRYDGNGNKIKATYTNSDGYSYVSVYTYEELQAAVEQGGNITLGDNIDIGENCVEIPANVTVNLDLAGYTLSGSAVYTIINRGTLIVDGGTVICSKEIAICNEGSLTVTSGSIIGNFYAIHALSGTVQLVGDSFTDSMAFAATVYWDSNDAYIDLSEYTGESLVIESATADMPLSNIILPAGWKLYDENNVKLSSTIQWGTIVAKAALAEDDDDGVIDTYEELQAAVNRGGDVTLGDNIDIGENCVEIPANVTVNLNLAGYTLSGSAVYTIINCGTLTVDGGTVIGSKEIAIFNCGSLTVIGGTVIGTDYAIYADSGTVTLVGDSFTDSVAFTATVYWGSNDAYIDLSEYTGESLVIESATADMPLSNIILPAGWKLYDDSDEELTATIEWGTIVAKAEIEGE